MLRSEELDRIKFELGVSPIRLGAEPFLAYVAIFDRVVQPFLYDNSTTSSTTVVASVTGAISTITLAANPAPPNNVGLTFQVGTSVVVDVGVLQEFSVIQSIAGLTVTLNLTLGHAGSYPVYPNGSEQMVRDVLARLDVIKSDMLSVAPRAAGVESVDEIKLFPHGSGRRGATRSKFDELLVQREQARNDLGELVGFSNLRSARRAAGSALEIY